ncbi:hypothetical protein [Kitasatospora sp. NPDC002040]|uniref:hypothetical protein n=1 Tax=Kitasatospora sp. NPDC002040 TaxID=3154661 RepID=UPI00332F8F1C
MIGRRLRTVAVFGVVALGCTACAGAGGPSTVIQQSELVGDWGNDAGARLHVSADHTATADGIDHAAPDYGCATASTAVSWDFLVRTVGESSLSVVRAATEGRYIELGIDAGSGLRGSCDLTAAVQRDDQGLNLCLVVDMDQTCTAEELLRRDRWSVTVSEGSIRTG